MMSGGSRLTDDSALTVIPCGWSPSSVVTTVTPVTKWPITRRNRSGAISAATGSGMGESLDGVSRRGAPGPVSSGDGPLVMPPRRGPCDRSESPDVVGT